MAAGFTQLNGEIILWDGKNACSSWSNKTEVAIYWLHQNVFLSCFAWGWSLLGLKYWTKLCR
jgi:hypothetical protein